MPKPVVPEGETGRITFRRQMLLIIGNHIDCYLDGFGGYYILTHDFGWRISYVGSLMHRL